MEPPVTAGTGDRPNVLVLCPNAAAAAHFRDTLVPLLHGGFDALPVRTWFGLAFDLVARHRGAPVRLLSASEQLGAVRRLLADESPADWPEHGQFLGREAFAVEVARAVLDHQRRPDEDWGELAPFARKYLGLLADRGEVDRVGLLAEATAAVEALPAGHDHVLVDDHDLAPPGAAGLLAALARPATAVTVVSENRIPWMGSESVELTRPFRQPAQPVLVTCPHPSTEAEAVAGELLAARAEGVAWSAMAVLVRHGEPRGRAVARALARHGIPVAAGAPPGGGLGDPAVAAIVDLLRWSTGDAPAGGRLASSPLSGLGADGLAALRDEVVAMAGAGRATPADVAFHVWERGLGRLVADPGGDGPGEDTSLDAVTAFLDRLADLADRDPGPDLAEVLARLDDGALGLDQWRVTRAAAGSDAVTVTSISASAGREWHTVVVVGCVEGELPRVRGRRPLFDPAAGSPAERRQASLAEERVLFRTACSRATGRLVATAAPAPGVLLSRFVEGWARRDARPPQWLGPLPMARQETVNDVAVFPGGELVLSASQLATYDDCPLRYAYQYGLRVRDEAGAPAALGTLVHEVLAEFLRPDPAPGAPARSHASLLALAADRWRDDIARYRPQVEECRRDYFAMLEAWWAAEGEGPNVPEVLAVEHRFEIEVAGIRLVGAIDRVDRVPDGDGDRGIRIVDYKTGRNELRAEALPDDLQLAVYHLAATLDPELVALGPPRQLQLLYLRSMHRLEQPIRADHAAVTAARVLEVAEAIRAERFEPAVDAACRTCPFHRLCPLQGAGREVGAA